MLGSGGGSKPSFWNASVPPFDQAVKRLLGRVGGWTWVACVPLTLVILATWGVAAQAQDEITAADVQNTLDNTVP